MPCLHYWPQLQHFPVWDREGYRSPSLLTPFQYPDGAVPHKRQYEPLILHDVPLETSVSTPARAGGSSASRSLSFPPAGESSSSVPARRSNSLSMESPAPCRVPVSTLLHYQENICHGLLQCPFQDR